MTDKLSAAMQIAQRINSLAQQQDDPALIMGAYHALAVTFHFLGDFESVRQYALRALQIWRSGSVQSSAEDFYTPAVGCLCYLTLSEWHLGEIASCHATLRKAISLAEELHDKQGLAVALLFAAILGQIERNSAEVERLASDLIELSTGHHFAFWRACGAILRGWAC